MRQKLIKIVESTMNYVSSQILKVKKLRNSKYHHGLHVANKKYKDPKGRVVAVRCDCAMNTCHPVFNGIVIWTIKTTVHHILVPKKKKRKRNLNPANIAV